MGLGYVGFDGKDYYKIRDLEALLREIDDLPVEARRELLEVMKRISEITEGLQKLVSLGVVMLVEGDPEVDRGG